MLNKMYKLLNSLNIEMVDDIECPQGLTDGIVVYYPNGEAFQIFVEDNKIVVLDEGNCVGIGTHKELLKSCDVYKEIALSQLSKEELENA